MPGVILFKFFFKGEINSEMKKLLITTGYESLDSKLVKKINLITGLGPQADRQIMQIKPTKNFADNVRGPFGSHASNIYVYSLICSGFFGLIMILSINLIVSYRIFILFLNKKKLNLHSNYYLNSAILIIFLDFNKLSKSFFSLIYLKL